MIDSSDEKHTCTRRNVIAHSASDFVNKLTFAEKAVIEPIEIVIGDPSSAAERTSDWIPMG